MKPTVSDIQAVARGAGEVLRQRFSQDRQIRHKSRFDIVTDADHAAEAFIIDFLRRNFPGHTIVSEESGEFRGEDGTWYIDPLDGTVNYAHGLPVFSVSIGYAEGGQVQLGAVYDPMREEMWYAERGGGAFVNGEQVHASETSDLTSSLLVTGFPYDVSDNALNLKNFAYFMRRTQGVRRLGSAALDLCYVASGRLDGYWEMELKVWDMAAGTLIAEEGGARVTDTQGSELYFKPPYDLIAAPPAMHDQILRALAQMQSGD